MNKIIILFSILLAIVSGLVFYIPTSNMGSMSGMMTQSHDECLFHCLTNGIIEFQNSVTLPLIISFIMGIVVVLFLTLYTQSKKIEYRIDYFEPLYQLKTVILRE